MSNVNKAVYRDEALSAVDPKSTPTRRNWRAYSVGRKRLRENLEQAERIIDVHKKVARLIGKTPPQINEAN